MARPIPRPAPVTNDTLLSNLIFYRASLII
jgi:hypothetical protein